MKMAAQLGMLGLIATLAACGGGGDEGASGAIPPFWTHGGVVVADFNADGRMDVALATAYVDRAPPHAGYAEVYLQTAAGVFSAPARYAIGPDPWGLSAGDVDGDGRLDLLIASPSTVAPQDGVINNSGGVSVLRQDPARPGQFLASQWISTGGAATDVAPARLNGDERADLVVADGVHINSRALLLPQSPTTPGAFGAPLSLPTGSSSGSQDLSTADLNGDGLSDIVLAASSNIVVLQQRAAGGFEPPVLLAAGVNAQGVEAADLDGDGRLDLVVANVGRSDAGATGSASLTILRQTNPGAFVSNSITVPDGARRVAVGDLNADGLPDIALVSIVYQALYTPSKVSVLLQSASQRGQFGAPDIYTGSANASFIAIADLNGDGRNDILLNDGPTVLWQSSTTAGRFDAVRPLR